ncbi:hypothetical protein KCU93_g10090, partial [Aureobasidium melanogenum]
MAFSISFTSGQFFEGKIFGSTSEDTTSVSDDEVLPEGLSWDLIPCEDEPRTGVAAPATDYSRRSASSQAQQQQQQQQQPQQTAQPDYSVPWLPPPVLAVPKPKPSNKPLARPKDAAPPYRPPAQLAAAPFQQPAQTAPSPASLGPTSKVWELPPKNKSRKRKRD